MGLTVVPIDDHTEVWVKDNVSMPDGWHLWMSLWRGGEIISTSDDVPLETTIVQDLADETLKDAARRFAAASKGSDPEPSNPQAMH